MILICRRTILISFVNSFDKSSKGRKLLFSSLPSTIPIKVWCSNSCSYYMSGCLAIISAITLSFTLKSKLSSTSSYIKERNSSSSFSIIFSTLSILNGTPSLITHYCLMTFFGLFPFLNLYVVIFG